tara:strand:- start:1897 stop:3531 length:1635 start_codon:yes stop_codon:yes gene_type:complete
MNNDTLSPSQQVLLDAVARLDEAELGAVEPAATFRPTSLASSAAPSFDLAAIAAASSNCETATSHSDDKPIVLEELPGACATAAEILAGITTGTTTAQEVLSAAQARIEACNPVINAIVTLSLDRATEEARMVDEVIGSGERPRPLSGLPLVHKDIIATRNIRTTAGSALLHDYVPTNDATVVSRLTNAGTLLVGKSNTHEFATGTTGNISYFGAVRNPWNLDHMAGGSSSGSAAALAAGMVCVATGTDTGGSIRIPASCCGIVGLKPTYGRVGRTGVMPFAWGLDHVGPMGRRVADIAALLSAMAGPDPFDRANSGEPTVDFSASINQGVKGLRFVVPDFCFLEIATEPVAKAVHEAANILEELGAHRVDVPMPSEFDLVGPAAITLFLAEGGAVHRDTLASHPEMYCQETRSFLSLAEKISAHAYLQAQKIRASLTNELARVFQSVDLMVTPTLAMTAPHRNAQEIEGAQGPLDVRAAMTLFTRPFNLTGLPALSLPCGFVDGMPIGLQLVGRPFEETTLLRAAHAYEEATEWHTLRPLKFP